MKNAILLLLCFCIFGCMGIFFYRDTLFLPPSHIHSWVQADKYAIALRYCEPEASFCLPRTYNLGGIIDEKNNGGVHNLQGITGSDLPVHEYLISRLMLLANTTLPFVFRLYVLLCSCAGYLGMSFLLFRLTGSFLKSLLWSGMLFGLPIITYYQAGFNPSATGLAGVWGAYSCYFFYLETKHLRWWYAAIALVTLSAIVRLPFNMCLIAIALQQILLALYQKKMPRHEWLALSIAGICVGVALGYKQYLYKKYGSLFLGEILPVRSFIELKELGAVIWQNWRFELLTRCHYLFVSISVLFFVGFRIVKYFTLNKNDTKQTNQQTYIGQILSYISYPHGALLFQVVLLMVGGTAYFLLMMQQYLAHEYYFLDNYYPAIGLLFAVLLYHFPVFKQSQYNIVVAIFAVLLWIGSLYESKLVQERKYSDVDWDLYELTRKNYENGGLLLDSLGIAKNAKILVLDALAPNTALLGLQREGFTVISTRRNCIDTLLKNAPFDYLTAQDRFLANPLLNIYPELLQKMERLDGNGKFSVFTLSKNATQKRVSLEALLGIDSSKTRRFVQSFDSTRQDDNHWLPYEHLQAGLGANPSGRQGFVNADIPFGACFKQKNADLGFKKCLFKGYFYTEQQSNCSLRIVLNSSSETDSKPSFYQEYPLKTYKHGQWQELYALFTLPDSLPPQEQLGCYIWNPKQCSVYFDDLSITFYNE